MTDTFEHNPGDHEDPVADTTWTISIVSAVLLLVTVLAVVAIYRVAARDQLESQFINQVPPALEKTRLAQAARLAGPPRWEVREKDSRSLVIPIDRAMETLVRESALEGRRP